MKSKQQAQISRQRAQDQKTTCSKTVNNKHKNQKQALGQKQRAQESTRTVTTYKRTENTELINRKQALEK